MDVDRLISFLDFVDEMVIDFERLMKEECSVVTESRLQHLCAQAERVLRGLRSIESYIVSITSSFPSNELTEDEKMVTVDFCHDLMLMTEWFFDTVIPSLNEMLDKICYSEKVKYFDDQRSCGVDMDQVVFMKTVGLTWVDISRILGVSRVTLFRHRKEAGILDNFCYSNLNDEEIEEKVIAIKHEMPEIGERMLLGTLKSQGIIIPRHRLRKAIHSIDPVGPSLRWRPHIQRRPYSVPGAMSLWHIGKYIHKLHYHAQWRT